VHVGGRPATVVAPPFAREPRVKIYTKTGDAGETGLVCGARVSKHDPRVAAYGEVDELNAALGVVLASQPEPALRKLLLEIQRDLFALGAQLADPSAKVGTRRPRRRSARHVTRLERRSTSARRSCRRCARSSSRAARRSLRSSTWPAACAAGRSARSARWPCREAGPLLLVYVNRLSDLLFVLARRANQRAGVAEEQW
jgi:cob(I)alamin adenosyltransferase